MGFKLPDLSELEQNSHKTPQEANNGDISTSSSLVDKNPTDNSRALKSPNNASQQIPVLPDLNNLQSEKAEPAPTSTPEEQDDEWEDDGFEEEVEEEFEPIDDLDIGDLEGSDTSEDSEIADLDISEVESEEGLSEYVEDNNTPSSVDDQPSDEDIELGDNIITGIVQGVRKNKNTIKIVMSHEKPEDGTFYLQRNRTGGNTDSVLENVKKNFSLTVSYDPEQIKSGADGNPLYIIQDVYNVEDPKETLEEPAPAEDIPEDDNEEDGGKKRNKPFSVRRLLSKLIGLNNKIGDKIYNVLAIPMGFLLKIPFVGGLLSRLKFVGKWLCKLWLVVIVLLILFPIVKAKTNANKGVYEVSQGNIKLQVSEPVYEKGALTVNVENTSDVYAYYYLNAKVTKKGILPFNKKTQECTSQSVGQPINGKMKLKFKCSGKSLDKANSYDFDIKTD